MIHENKTHTVKNVHQRGFCPGYQYAFIKKLFYTVALGRKDFGYREYNYSSAFNLAFFGGIII